MGQVNYDGQSIVREYNLGNFSAVWMIDEKGGLQV